MTSYLADSCLLRLTSKGPDISRLWEVGWGTWLDISDSPAKFDWLYRRPLKARHFYLALCPELHMYHRCWAKANFFLFRFEFNSKAGRKFAQKCFNQDSCECRQVICLSLTYSGRKCDGWTAAFNRGSLLCLGATPSPSATNPPHPPPPTSQ